MGWLGLPNVLRVNLIVLALVIALQQYQRDSVIHVLSYSSVQYNY